MEKIAIRRDANLLTMARNIFGASVVKDAFVSTWDIDSDRAEVMERIQHNSYRHIIDDEIQYDGEDIIIEFSGGNKVIFRNSEWASIEIFDEDESYII